MRKLCYAALGYAGALLLSHYLLPERFWLAAAAAAAVLSLAGFALKNKARWVAMLVLGFVAMGFLWNWGHYQLRVAPADALVGREERVAAVVLDYPASYDSYERVTLRLRQEGLPAAKVYVYDYAHELADVRPGDLLEMELRFFTAMESWGEDVDTYRSSGVFVRASLVGDAAVTGRWKGRVLLLPRELSHALCQKISASFPEDTAPFLMALLTGNKQAIYEQTQVYTPLKLAGLTHVIAVSGMHVAFLVGAVNLLIAHRRRAAMLSLPLIGLFVLLAGMSPSVMRAGVMQSMLLMAPILKRENDGPTTLASAAMMILLLNPESVASLSFQLSFAAMAGILLLSQPVYLWLRGEHSGQLSHTLCSVVGTSISAMAFTLPLSVLYFGFIPLYAVLGNVLCLWAVTLSFTLAYAVCFLTFLWPAAAAFAGTLVGWLPRYIFAVSSAIARFPFAALYTGTPWLRWWLLGVYLLFFVAWLLKGKGKALRPVIPLCLCLVSLAAISLVQRKAVPEGEMSITAVDVGQGQSIVALQDGSAVVIDCGGSVSGGAGERTAEHLQAMGQRRVELLVLTHLHADHANGVLQLMELVELQRIALPQDADDAGLSQPILDRADELGVEVLLIEEDSLVRVGDLHLTLIAPLGEESVNERGLMVLGRFGAYDFLVTGDADMDTEALLTYFYDLPALELLVVGHHGSRYSTSTELLDETTPAAAFISVGYNSYGHPHETVLQRLSQYGVDVYRTDEEGNVTMTVGEHNG